MAALDRATWFLLVATLSLLSAGAACPSMCICKWKSGKEWVECAKRNLNVVPEGAREETQVLVLSDNSLGSLPSECFRALNLTNLQRLYLSRSQIRHISPTAFLALSGLVELDLSLNYLSDVPTEALNKGCQNLMKLMLNGNPIRDLRRDTFRALEQLTNLELSDCAISNIEQGAFNGLHSLERLRLNGNKLSHVPEMTLPLGINLKTLTLHQNSWICDCNLLPLQTWIRESAQQAPQESEPICQAPDRLHGRHIKAVKMTDLACMPTIHLPIRMDIYEGANITLECDVFAVPAAKVTWYFAGELYEPQDNDSFTSSSRIRYSYKQRGQNNTTSSLSLYDIESMDEGVYTCTAENNAGITKANLTLRILYRERTTTEPPYDPTASGYVAVVAAGALVGLIIALGCIVGSALVCARRCRQRKRKTNALATQNKNLTPIEKNVTVNEKGEATRSEPHQAQEAQPQTVYSERDVNRTLAMDQEDNLLESSLSPVPKYFTEPDLINQMPETNDGYLFQHRVEEFDRYTIAPNLCPNFPQTSYLDQDGYPPNYGLPKVPFNSSCTLPRLRTRPIEGLTAIPMARYSREAEFLARSSVYEVIVPRTDTRYTAKGYPYPSNQPLTLPVRNIPLIPASPISPVNVIPEVPFIPSPPAEYRCDPTPLSPRSLMGKSAREAASVATVRAEGAQLEHPESPDEGYVGDAMDV